MSEIIDVLTLQPNYAPFFTVPSDGSATSKSVPMQNPNYVSLGNYPLMKAAGGLGRFNPGDNFTVLTAGFCLPESFVLASSPADCFQNNVSINLGTTKQQTGLGSVFYLPNFGADGIQLPLENYEMPLGIFVDVTKLDPSGGHPFMTNPFWIFGIFEPLQDTPALVRPQVSMIGVPSQLYGTTHHVTVFIKVLHNLALS